MKTVKLEQGTPTWLKFRMGGVGGSEIASIAGVEGAFQKRSDVLAEKLGARREISDYQRRIFADGHQWEELVRSSLNEQGHAFLPVVAVHPDNERFFASLDGVDENTKTVLEVKSVVTREKFEAYLEKTPAHYVAQVQWELFVTGYQKAIIAFVHAGEVVTKEIFSDENLQNRLQAFAIEFLQELDAIKGGTQVAPVQSLTSDQVSRLVYLKKAQTEMKIQLDMIDVEIESIADSLIKKTNATKLESDEITIAVVERKGSVNYSKIPEVQRLGESYLNSFRGKGSSSIQVKLKGTN